MKFLILITIINIGCLWPVPIDIEIWHIVRPEEACESTTTKYQGAPYMGTRRSMR